MTGPNDKPASPFAGVLDQKPKDIAREAERVLDSPHRQETEEAQAAKAKSKAAAEKDGAGGDEVVSVNVRNPLPR